ncbi:hypothetical protein DFH09DRAFT_5495 [Mycena vulgaris]|nr:hypothetical protein DFH09DRAFT_5495 [Mycena vulgaris]
MPLDKPSNKVLYPSQDPSLAPITVIPFEILSDIFIHCLPENSAFPNATEAPLLLGQICSAWRYVALSTPMLWCSLAIRYEEKPDADSLALWLSRARRCALAICVIGQRQHHGSRVLFDTICQYSPQWRYLEFAAPFDVLSQLHVGKTLPLLEKLVIGSRVATENNELVTVFSDAPRLSNVQITLDGRSTTGPGHIILPWAQLTSFTGSQFSLEECLYVLLSAPSLVNATFDYVGRIRGQHVSPLPPLPHLKSLTLFGHDTETLVEIMRCLTAPALEILNLVSAALLPSPIVPESLLSFFARSSCPVREFSMSVLQGSSEQTVLCLSGMPALQVLHLRSFGAAHHLIALLHGESHLVPILRHLSIQSFDRYIMYPELIAMLSSRADASAGRSLQSFKLELERAQTCPEHEILDGFAALARKGMDVQVGHRGGSWI